jgi:hypothetical protein
MKLRGVSGELHRQFYSRKRTPVPIEEEPE